MKKQLNLFLSFVLFASLVVMDGHTALALGKKTTLRLAVQYLPESLDPSEAMGSTEKTVVKGLFEGLVRLDEQGKAVPGMAKGWKISKDGKTYTFSLRPNAVWSNKQRVKASDFEYAWKRAVSPESDRYDTFKMYVIANAQSFHSGKIKDSSKVGVKALNESTLQVTLSEKTSYFPQLLAETIYYPVYAASAKKDMNWAYQASTLVTNGPFKLKNWNTQAITLVKNSSYYNTKAIHWAEVQFIATEDAPAAYANNKVDWFGSPYFSGDDPLVDTFSRDLHRFHTSSTYYYQFNLTEAPFHNLKIRKALAMAVEREQLELGTPAFGFIPPGIHGVKGNYRSEVLDVNYFKEDVMKAQRLLQEGLAEEGLTELPKFKIIMNNTTGHINISNLILNSWKKNLGIDAEIETQEWLELLDNRENKTYQIARAGWGADYNDPATFLEYFTSWSPYNDSGWSDMTYDSYIKQARQTADASVRNKLYAKAEKRLIDQMVILPLYYYTYPAVHKPNLTGVYIDFDESVEFIKGYFK